MSQVAMLARHAKQELGRVLAKFRENAEKWKPLYGGWKQRGGYHFTFLIIGFFLRKPLKELFRRLPRVTAGKKLQKIETNRRFLRITPKGDAMKFLLAALLVVPLWGACPDLRELRSDLRREAAELRKEAYRAKMDARRERTEALRDAHREVRRSLEEVRRELRETREEIRSEVRDQAREFRRSFRDW
jgi:hypothetical protein